MGLYMSAVDTAIAREKTNLTAARGGSTSQLQGQGLGPGFAQGPGLGPGFAQGPGLDASNASGNPWYGMTAGGVRTGGGGDSTPLSRGKKAPAVWGTRARPQRRRGFSQGEYG